MKSTDHRIIVVGRPQPSHERYGTVVISPPVKPYASRPGLNSKQVAIEHAMHDAVRISLPGDIILQDDMKLIRAPWLLTHRFNNELDGWVQLYHESHKDPRLANHECPRSFSYSDISMKGYLLGVWDPTRPHRHGENACEAWAEIPKIRDGIAAIHPTELGVPPAYTG